MSALLLESSAAQRLPDGIALQRMPIFDNITIPMPFIIDKLQPSIISVSSPSIIDRSQNATQFTIEEEATGPDGAVVRFTANVSDNIDGTATLEEDGTTMTQDNTGGDITISCERPSGSEFPIGETVVECTASDAAGNIASMRFSVVVQDTIGPVFINVPENMTVETDGNSTEVTYTLTAEDAVSGAATLGQNNILTQGDDVGGDITISCERPSGSEFPIGETVVECTASDAAGNITEEQFQVTVIARPDNTPPNITINPTQTNNNPPVAVP